MLSCFTLIEANLKDLLLTADLGAPMELISTL